MSDFECFAVWTACVFILGCAAGVSFLMACDFFWVLVGYVVVAVGWL